jgi:hypothetical protein
MTETDKEYFKAFIDSKTEKLGVIQQREKNDIYFYVEVSITTYYQ